MADKVIKRALIQVALDTQKLNAQIIDLKKKVSAIKVTLDSTNIKIPKMKIDINQAHIKQQIQEAVSQVRANLRVNVTTNVTGRGGGIPGGIPGLTPFQNAMTGGGNVSRGIADRTIQDIQRLNVAFNQGEISAKEYRQNLQQMNDTLLTLSRSAELTTRQQTALLREYNRGTAIARRSQTTLADQIRMYTRLGAVIATTVIAFHTVKRAYNLLGDAAIASVKKQKLLNKLVTDVDFAEAQEGIESFAKSIGNAIPTAVLQRNFVLLRQAGVGTSEIMEFFAASAGIAASKGLDLSEALNRATEAAILNKDELNENAGIMVDVSTKNDAYAKSLGTTTEKLSTQQKVIAQVLGVIKESDDTGALGNLAANLDAVTTSASKLKQAGADLQIAFGTATQDIFLKFNNFLVTVINNLTGLFDLINLVTNAFSDSQLVGQLGESLTGANKATSADEAKSLVVEASRNSLITDIYPERVIQQAVSAAFDAIDAGSKKAGDVFAANLAAPVRNELGQALFDAGEKVKNTAIKLGIELPSETIAGIQASVAYAEPLTVGNFDVANAPTELVNAFLELDKAIQAAHGRTLTAVTDTKKGIADLVKEIVEARKIQGIDIPLPTADTTVGGTSVDGTGSAGVQKELTELEKLQNEYDELKKIIAYRVTLRLDTTESMAQLRELQSRVDALGAEGLDLTLEIGEFAGTVGGTELGRGFQAGFNEDVAEILSATNIADAWEVAKENLKKYNAERQVQQNFIDTLEGQEFLSKVDTENLAFANTLLAQMDAYIQGINLTVGTFDSGEVPQMFNPDDLKTIAEVDGAIDSVTTLRDVLSESGVADKTVDSLDKQITALESRKDVLEEIAAEQKRISDENISNMQQSTDLLEQEIAEQTAKFNDLKEHNVETAARIKFSQTEMGKAGIGFEIAPTLAQFEELYGEFTSAEDAVEKLQRFAQEHPFYIPTGINFSQLEQDAIKLANYRQDENFKNNPIELPAVVVPTAVVPDIKLTEEVEPVEVPLIVELKTDRETEQSFQNLFSGTINALEPVNISTGVTNFIDTGKELEEANQQLQALIDTAKSLGYSDTFIASLEAQLALLNSRILPETKTNLDSIQKALTFDESKSVPALQSIGEQLKGLDNEFLIRYFLQATADMEQLEEIRKQLQEQLDENPIAVKVDAYTDEVGNAVDIGLAVKNKNEAQENITRLTGLLDSLKFIRAEGVASGDNESVLKTDELIKSTQDALDAQYAFIDDANASATKFAAQIVQAAAQAANLLIQGIKSGDAGSVISGLGGAVSAFGFLDPSGTTSAIGAVLGLFGGLISAFTPDPEKEKKAERERAESANRSIPAININFEVNQSNTYNGSPADPINEQAFRKQAIIVFEEFYVRGIKPRLDRLESKLGVVPA